MKKIVRFIIFLFIIAGALAIFKPTANNFEEWIKKDAAEKRGAAQGENVVEKLIDKGTTTATQLQLLATYHYSNHYILAIVDASANGEDLKFAGIAGLWIQLP